MRRRFARLAYRGLVAALTVALTSMPGCRKSAALDPGGQELAELVGQGKLQGDEAKNGKLLATPTAPNVGFDRNDYPGDARLAQLHQRFVFAGYWLNAPPGESATSWLGKRKVLRDAGFGFLVLWNGRLEAEIKAAGVEPDALGRQDAEAALSAARREGFPAGATIFLDQEQGGRLTATQSAYFFAWTEAIASGGYTPGAYLSGQAVPDGIGTNGQPVTIRTAENVLQQVKANHFHPVTLWVYEDTCPPSPGCTLSVGRSSGSNPVLGADVWQYAQSPRRPANTRACAATYAADNNCHAGTSSDLPLDLDIAASADPSHGR